MLQFVIAGVNISIVNWDIHTKINAVVITREVNERNKRKIHRDKVQHQVFRQIKIVGENFWRSKDSGKISLRYTVCSS
jgi:hypothetical protein